MSVTVPDQPDTVPPSPRKAGVDLSAISPRRRLVGALVLVLTVQYLVAELVTASAWSDPAYDWANNYISDLGVTECVTVGRVVCSPLHVVMNVGFVVQGLIAIAAVILLGPVFARVRRVVLSVLGIVHGVGLVLVGGFPGSFAEVIGGSEVQMAVHSIGALLAILGGALWVLATGIAIVGTHRVLGVIAIVLGATPLVALVLSRPIAAVLGEAGLERLGVYPTVGWLILAGSALFAASRRS